MIMEKKIDIRLPPSSLSLFVSIKDFNISKI